MNLEKLDRKKKRNREQRVEFIKFWANYVKTHDDDEWSGQQEKLINSLI